MATIKYKQNGTTYSCWSSTGRVTTPSLCFKEGSTTKYVPLFAVGNGAEGNSGNYYYKVGSLCARHNGTVYRAAMSRRYADSFSRTISGTISHSNVPVIVGGFPSGTVVFEQKFSVNYSGSGLGVYSDSIDVTVMFSRPDIPPFISAPTYEETHVDRQGGSIQDSRQEILYWGADKCIIRVTVIIENPSSSGSPISGTFNGILYVDVNGLFGTVSYPDETKSVTASGDFNYGHTFGSAPSLSADNGVSVSNNSGNASFHASKTLTGTVSYNSSKTLSQAFNVWFSGEA